MAKDHEESMRLLNEASEEEKKTSLITARRNQLSKEYGQVRLEVYFWEEAWRMVKTCQKFLYQVSPASWREKHHLQIFKDESDSNLTFEKSSDLFSSTRTVEDAASLMSLIGK